MRLLTNEHTHAVVRAKIKIHAFQSIIDAIL